MARAAPSPVKPPTSGIKLCSWPPVGPLEAFLSARRIRQGISKREEIDQQIDEADGRARRVLEAHRDKVLKLTDLLIDGDVDRTTFERLMNDGMPPAN